MTAAATLCVLVDFLRRPRSNSLSLRNQLAIYGIQRCVGVFGAYQGRKMERDSRRFMEVSVYTRCVQCAPCSVRRRCPRVVASYVSLTRFRLREGNARRRRGPGGDRVAPSPPGGGQAGPGGSFPTELPQLGTACRGR